MVYKICTFNIQKFNSVKKPDRPALIADMIRRNEIDVLAIQEVMRKEAFDAVLNRIKDQWDGSYAFSGTAGEGGEGYAFFWKKRRLTLVQGERVSGKQLKNPQVIDNRRSVYLRPPFYIRLKPTQTKVDFELRLLTIHVRFSNNKRFNEVESQEENDNDNPQDLRTLEARRAEIDALLKKYERINIPSSEEAYSKVAYTIILGDYNLCLKGSPLLTSFGSDRACRIINRNSSNKIILKTTGNYKTTLRTVPKDVEEYIKNDTPVPIELENRTPDKWSHNYDHFTYNINQMGDAHYNGKEHPLVSELGSTPSWKQVYDYREHYSDHVPLLYSFDLANGKVIIEDLK